MSMLGINSALAGMYQFVASKGIAETERADTTETSFINQLKETGGTAGTSRVDAYTEYLRSKYGNVRIQNVGKDQQSLDKIGKSMSGSDVVIAPNMLEQMAKAVKGNCSRYNPVPDEIIIRNAGSMDISDNDKQRQQEPAKEIIESYEPRFSLGQVAYTYANEADFLNVVLFGKTAKQWKEENSTAKGNMRDIATLNQLLVLANLESYNAVLINQGKNQRERMELLRQLALQQLQTLETVSLNNLPKLEDN